MADWNYFQNVTQHVNTLHTSIPIERKNRKVSTQIERGKFLIRPRVSNIFLIETMLDWNQSNDVIYNLCSYRSLSSDRGVFYAELDLVWDAEQSRSVGLILRDESFFSCNAVYWLDN